MKIDLLEVWNNGYDTGYVQARADRGDLTQEEADKGIRHINEDIVPHEENWAQRTDANIEEEETPEEILTDSERRKAVEAYKAGLSFQDIASNLLVQRNMALKREMTKEIGRVCSKAINRQMYPVEFYGKLEE